MVKGTGLIAINCTAWNCFCRQIIEGTEVLKAMETQNTNNERPLKDIKVTDSGICTYEF